MLDIHTDKEATYIYVRINEHNRNRIRTAFYLLLAGVLFWGMVQLLYAFPDYVEYDEPATSVIDNP